MSDPNDTAGKFSRDELQQIRNTLGTPSADLVCPRCEGPLTVSHPVDGPRGPCFFVACRQCRNKSVITDVPGLWQPAPRG